MNRAVCGALLLVVLITGCNGEETESVQDADEEGVNGESAESVSEDLQIQAEVEDLNIPWSINKVNDTFYISEREGSIAVIENGVINREDIDLQETFTHEGEGGLLGFVLHPEFEENNQAFLYYTYLEDGLKNRIVIVERDNGEWTEKDVIKDNIPGDSIHNGGRLAIGPDGYLYATTGDASEPDLAQDENNLAGSILRLTLDGDVPEDNPFEDSAVFSYGHRNPQGLSWDSEGTMYSTEHGPVGEDEINRIEAGNNYGWPLISGDETEEGMEEPLLQSGEDTWAPSGSAMINDRYLLVTGLRGEALFGVDVEEETIERFFEGEGRLRDVFIKEETVYIITNNTDGRGQPQEGDDRLVRIDNFFQD
ncbi:sorbosone dehydrogenase family protein [Thalassobacillus sp. C254]|uniref:PQQ-dependent sugar dehydrogenase n=1 Tax=Thalassobacillus sp. C254 TaxID=1225341 RepID=UPI0006D1C9D1|nr:PQQ-dependent sugar dehydrogenase [Thalassobacillus sp. C254]